jgi:hypothetical protein
MPVEELANFRGFRAIETVAQEDRVFVRLHDPGFTRRPYWQEVIPDSELQWRIDSAVLPEWRSSGSKLSILRIPKGHALRVWQGEASYQGGAFVGGGTQYYIPNPPKAWIKTADSPWGK